MRLIAPVLAPDINHIDARRCLLKACEKGFLLRRASGERVRKEHTIYATVQHQQHLIPTWVCQQPRNTAPHPCTKGGNCLATLIAHLRVWNAFV